MEENSSKVIRDRIPEIIRLSGRRCVVNELSDFSFLPELEKKLKEELKEYLESKIVEDREFEVRTEDVVVVPVGKRFWFRGYLKQICVTAPAWEEQYEHHIRDLDL